MTALAHLFDPVALTIVGLGTVFATLARCGWSDVSAVPRGLARHLSSAIDANANRIALAKTVRAIRAKGLLVAEVPMPPDAPLASCVKAYLRSGSMGDLEREYTAGRATRQVDRSVVAQVFDQAGELAPVFGLVGTLYSITLIASDTATAETAITISAVSTAVLSSLYGVLFAHLICIPIGHAIERKGTQEEWQRSQLIDWLGNALENNHPSPAGRLRQAA